MEESRNVYLTLDSEVWEEMERAAVRRGLSLNQYLSSLFPLPDPSDAYESWGDDC